MAAADPVKPDEVVFRVDATYHLTVEAGDRVCAGQALCEGAGPEAECICPVSGTVRSLRFDPERHEFIICMSKSETEQEGV